MTMLRIGELAEKTNCSAETIRYYEKEGLLAAPARSEGNYRLYNDQHMERVLFIRHCRSLDMTLDEVRDMLACQDKPNENCQQVSALLNKHIGHVAQKIKGLQILQQELQHLLKQCDNAQTTANCGILHGLTHLPEQAIAHIDCHQRGGSHA